jgi:hypothetical protein
MAGLNMNNPLAFPYEERTTQGSKNHFGMTLRDYFAAKAMFLYFQGPDENEVVGHPDAIAAWCYIMADSMLKAKEA